MRMLMLLSGVLLALPVTAAELKLRVHSENLLGKEVRVALYDSAHGFPDNDDEARTAKQLVPDNKIIANEVAFLFSDLPPGVYAVAAFADSNSNGKLDRNFLGIPSEPYGFSRDARGLTSAPGFAEAAFRVGETDAIQTLQLK